MKRIFDVFFALLGLVFLSPFFIIISIAIVLSSKGSVFFVQERVGKRNSTFKLIKFRTMYVQSAQKGLLTVGMRDSRITSIGYFLRKFKLDELPQLINILKGEMSFVGPRPEVRKYVNYYTAEQMRVLEVLPGLTDFASIEYFDENRILAAAQEPEKTYIEFVMPHKLFLNLKYIEQMSLATDLKILYLTLIKIIGK
jgi:lipopolysaccharide/colanic/teichoic acid biosynthesis glycosyltransferase